MNRSTSIILSLAAAALLCGANAARADDSVVVKTVVVHIGDLNMHTAQGAEILRRRIVSAASYACGGNPHFAVYYRDAPSFTVKAFEQCRDNAINKAYAGLGQPLFAEARTH